MQCFLRVQTMPFTQVIAFKGYLDNLGKPLNSTLNDIHLKPLTEVRNKNSLITHRLLYD